MQYAVERSGDSIELLLDVKAADLISEALVFYGWNLLNDTANDADERAVALSDICTAIDQFIEQIEKDQ